ncbi:MAG: tetratricopeptide repeat protein, partial [Candidatus Omnitrophica bacterium]|nr:tetratricopeptide repeat protein [Candidatus Omnitrophota bacterium]
MLKSFVIFLFLLCISNFAIIGHCDESVLSASNNPSSKNNPNYYDQLQQLVKESQDNIKYAGNQLKEHESIKKNQLREEQAKEYYQRGLQLTEEGQFDEAKKCFQKAIQITEVKEMAKRSQEGERRLRIQEIALRKAKLELTREQQEQQNILDQKRRVNEAIQRQKKAETKLQEIEKLKNQQQEIENAYQEAFSLYNNKKYTEAKDIFNKVENLKENYKLTRNYIRIIDHFIAHEDMEKEKQKELQIRREQKEAQLAKENEERAKRQAEIDNERLLKEELNKQIENDYNAALDLFRDKIYLDAKEKFLSINKTSPGYKATDSYLRQINRILSQDQLKASIQESTVKKVETNTDDFIKKQQEELLQKSKELEEQRKTQQELDKLYEDAVSLYRKKNYSEAQKAFSDIEIKRSDYKSVRSYQKIIAKRLAQIEQENLRIKQEEQRKQQVQEKLAQLKKEKEDITHNQLVKQIEINYSAALDLYKDSLFREAKEKFIVVSNEDSHYKDTETYLKGIDQQIIQQDKRQEEEKQKQIELKNKQEDELKQKMEEARQQKESEIAKMNEKRAKERMLKDAEKDYRSALSLYRRKNYNEAKEKFEIVQNKVPDYKATNSYLKLIEEAIQNQQKQEEEKKKVLDLKEEQSLREKQDEEKRIEQRNKDFEEKEKQNKLEEQKRNEEKLKQQQEMDRKQEELKKNLQGQEAEK